MRVHLAGVRGSTPAPGAEFVRTGGHTSCVAVLADGDDVPRLVLDAGTGLRRVTGLLDGGPFRGTILLTHLHWDHTQGLPFFTSADRGDAATTLVMPAQGDPVEVLGRAMSPPHFPIGPEGLGGTWAFRGIEPGRHDFEGFTVDAFEVPHKGGRTYGYRVGGDGRSMAYVPDHLPERRTDPGVIAAVRGVDLLVHDAQFTDAEAGLARAYGHATIDQAVGLARDAEVGELLLFHHAPGRDDDAVEDLLAASRRISGPDGPLVTAAREGDTLRVGAPADTPAHRSVARQR